MKIVKLYIDKDYLAKKLGVSVNDLVIADVKSNINSIEFSVILDDSSNPNMLVSENLDTNIRRQKLL